MSTYIIATADTRSFEWTALGQSEHECNTALLTAFERHVHQSPDSDPLLMLDLIESGDVNYAQIRMGEALRDGSPV